MLNLSIVPYQTNGKTNETLSERRPYGGGYVCEDHDQCWEPCGRLGHDEDHMVFRLPSKEERDATSRKMALAGVGNIVPIHSESEQHAITQEVRADYANGNMRRWMFELNDKN